MRIEVGDGTSAAIDAIIVDSAPTSLWRFSLGLALAIVLVLTFGLGMKIQRQRHIEIGGA